MFKFSNKLNESHIQLNKHDVISKVASLDYLKIIQVVNGISTFFPSSKSLLPCLCILKDDSDIYIASAKETKDDEFITYLTERCDVKLLKSSLEPISNKIPGGSAILGLVEIIDNLS